VAGVRGTVLVGEVLPGAGSAPPVTNFYVLRGTVDAAVLDPATRTATGPLQTIGTLQSLTITGANAARVAPIRTNDVPAITAGLQAKADRASAGEDDVKAQARATAVTL